MELFTLNRNTKNGITDIRFEREYIIEEFDSLIWTERFYGDSEINFTLPVTMEWVEKIPLGTFIGIDQSHEIMIVETINIEDQKLKIQGISLLSWLDNRFVRTSKWHKTQAWEIEDMYPGEILWYIIDNMVGENSYGKTLDCSVTDIHDDYLSKFYIPDIGLHNLDKTGSKVTLAVAFGPLYTELRKIAETYKIGMQMVLETNFDPDRSKPLGFRTYRGVNKTYTQIIAEDPKNPIVRFSQELESLTNVKELQSQSKFKTIAFAFAPNLECEFGDIDGANGCGVAYSVGMDANDSFNCRAIQVFNTDLTGYPDPLSNKQIRKIMSMLDLSARQALREATMIKAVDGEIVSTHMFKYGEHYNLGDLVEIQGPSGTISIGRVIEYIRAQDTTGERGYPTVEIVEAANQVESPDLDDRAPAAVLWGDKIGDAVNLPGDDGYYGSTNIDCTTDGITVDGNTDWLVYDDSPLGATDKRNWHTMWFKWAVPLERWGAESVFSAFLTDYDTHMVLFLCTPLIGAIPPEGESPSVAGQFQFISKNHTGRNRKPPYDMLQADCVDNFWVEPSSCEPYIYIGVATPPVGVFGTPENHGGRFNLQWGFIP